MTENEHPEEFQPVQPDPPSRKKWVVLGLMVFFYIFIYLGMPQGTEKDKWMARIFPAVMVLVTTGAGWLMWKIAALLMLLPGVKKVLTFLIEEGDDGSDSVLNDPAKTKKDKLNNPDWYKKE